MADDTSPSVDFNETNHAADRPPPDKFQGSTPGPNFTEGGRSSDQSWGEWAGQGARDFAGGVGRGLVGDVYGAGQLASDVLPTSITDPIARSSIGRSIKETAKAPDPGWAGTAGRWVGGSLPFMAMPELGLGRVASAALGGGLAGGIQPTESGSLGSHALGAGLGAATGGALGTIGGGEAGAAMRGAGVRLTPGQQIPLVGPAWEALASRMPGLNKLVGNARQVSLDDFQKALYQQALDPIGGAAPSAAGYDGLQQVGNTVRARLDNIMVQSEVPQANVQALNRDINNIITMSGSLTDPYLKLLERNVDAVLGNQRQLMSGLSGRQLVGPNGVLTQLRARIFSLKNSGDGGARDVGQALSQVEDAVLAHANINTPGGRADLDAAHQAYSRFKTLDDASDKGVVDPRRLLTELDKRSKLGSDMAGFATKAQQAGVPNIGQVHPPISPWESAVALYGGEHFLGPKALLALPPALLYNRPGMTALMGIANQAQRVAAAGGAGAGQAAGATGYEPSF